MKKVDVRRVVALCVCGVMMAGVAYAGGGWTKKKGKGYFKLGQSAIVASQFFQPNGLVVDITTVSLYTSYLYGEYGITDRLEAVVYAPVFVRMTLNRQVLSGGEEVAAGDEYSGIGDINVGLNYGILQNGPWVMAGKLLIGVASGNPEGGSTRILQTGDGEYNQMLSLATSRAFTYTSSLSGYATVEAGVNNRTQDFSEEFRFGVETGLAWQKAYFILRVLGVLSFYNGAADDTSAAQGIFFQQHGVHLSPIHRLLRLYQEFWSQWHRGNCALRKTNPCGPQF